MLKITGLVIDNYYRFRYYTSLASIASVCCICIFYNSIVAVALGRNVAPIKTKSKVIVLGLF